MSSGSEDLFSENKDNCSISLFAQFHNLVQGDMTVTAYLHEQKHLAVALYDTGFAVDDRVVVLNIVRGLSHRLSNVASNIAMSPQLPNFVA